MSFTAQICLCTLLVICGWALRGALGGRWRRVKNPHRLGDPGHFWIELHGRVCAFTDDQMDVAAARAATLEEPKKRMKRFFWWTLTVTGLVIIMLLTACGYAKHKDPPTYVYDNPKVASESARLHAKDIGGEYMQNVCCGSMQPLIFKDDWLVTQATPYGDHLLGKVAIYKPKWRDGQPVMHRLVSGNAKDGFIASGDNTPRSEASERVTAANYVSEVVGIYRYVP